MREPDIAKIVPKRSLGQNFLLHRRIAERIVLVAEVQNTDTVLEIGPGTGMLTRELLKKAEKVVAVEADADLLGKLQEDFAEEIKEGKLQLILGDIRTADLQMLPKEYKLVANIPYYITGDIIRTFLTTLNKPASIMILVQKEVAERIARSKKESILSLSVRAFGTPKYQFTVPRGAFFPPPNVDSAVLSISTIASPFASAAEEEHFFTLVHAGFAHKRKFLARNLEVNWSAKTISRAFVEMNLSEKIRAEDVPLTSWISLAKKLPNT